MKQFECEVCSKSYSRQYRLKLHMKESHDTEIVGSQVSRFFCPFGCDVPPFRTVKLLLVHCEVKHEHSLGQYITV